jgi:hypothetical protein
MKEYALKLVDHLLGDDPDSRGYFWRMVGTGANPKKITTLFDRETFPLYYETFVEQSQIDRLWIGLGRVAPSYAKSEYQRPSSADVTGIAGFFLDVDVNDGTFTAHSKKALPTTRDEALAYLESLRMPPTMIVDSGYGLHAHWLVNGLAFPDEETRRAAQQQLKRLSSEALGAAFANHGWDLDATPDLARIARLPGTYNIKNPADPKPVTVISGVGPTYRSLDEIKLSDFSLPTVRAGAVARTSGGPPGSQAACSGAHAQTVGTLLANANAKWKKASAEAAKNEAPAPKANIASVAEGCNFLSHALHQAAKLSEPEWFTMLGIVGHCNDGTVLAHAASKPHPSYNKAETAAKLKGAREYPVTCARVAAEHPGHCQDCPLNGLVKTPLKIGETPVEIVKLGKSWVFWPTAGKFLDLLNFGHEVAHRAFDTAHRRLHWSASEALSLSPALRNISGKDYVPGGPRMIPQDRWWSLNTYQDPGLDETRIEEVEQVFLEHVSYLAGGDNAQTQHLVNYLASVCQSPEKIKHAVLIISRQGVGKTLLADAMEGALGRTNFCSDKFARVNAKFNEHIHDKQLLVIEELQSDKREAYNDIKTLITETRGKAEPKGKAVRETRHPVGILIFSNDDVPILVEESDRRFYVLKVSDVQREQAAYDEFARVVLENPGALRGFLKSIDISAFNRMGRPPETEAKRELLKNSRGHAEDLVEEAVSQRLGPGFLDVTTEAQWREYLRAQGKPLPPNKVGAILLGQGLKRTQIRIGDGTKRRVWIVRDFEALSDHDEIRKRLRGQGFVAQTWGRADPRIEQLRLARLQDAG